MDAELEQLVSQKNFYANEARKERKSGNITKVLKWGSRAVALAGMVEMYTVNVASGFSTTITAVAAMYCLDRVQEEKSIVEMYHEVEVLNLERAIYMYGETTEQA